LVEQRYWLLDDSGHVGAAFRQPQLATPPPNAWSVLRSPFDAWLASQAEAAGATLLSGTLVESLIQDQDRQVIGIRTGLADGDLLAPCVIIAEGVNPQLVSQLQPRQSLQAGHTATAVKEIRSLPQGVIEDRFNLEPGQGAAIELFGTFSKGALGQAFVYTNRGSLSIGMGVLTSHLANLPDHLHDLFEAFKNHPSLRGLLSGSTLAEYSAHLIPEGGFAAMPKLSGPGWLVAGDAAMLVNSVRREGSNLAIQSGLYAAEVAVAAHHKQNFSARSFAAYDRLVLRNYPGQDLRYYQKLVQLAKRSPHFFSLYPHLVNDMAREFFRVDGIPKRRKQVQIVRQALARRGLFKTLGDLLAIGGSLL
jgi:electron transfer flavoprotein-quinone oxidoreductase